MAYIQVRDLWKSYGGRAVVKGVTFGVERGEVVGILGPNGSGKTTTVECLGGLRVRDKGVVSIGGVDPATSSPALRQELGMQLQECRMPAKITVVEAIDLYRSFYPRPRATSELLERFGLHAERDVRFEKLSGGQQQRLSVALALVGNPRIAILDELTTGLDPAGRREIWSYLTELRRAGLTIVLVTHYLDEAEHLCDRVILFREGRIVAAGAPRELVNPSARGQTMTFVPSRPFDEDEVRAIADVTSVTLDGDRVIVSGHDDMAGTVLAGLGARGVVAHELRLARSELEDAYLALTGAGNDQAASAQ